MQASTANTVKAFLFYFVQFTWGLSANIAGGLLFLIFRINGSMKEKYRLSIITYIDFKYLGGFSLGIFIFINKNCRGLMLSETKMHEYGHTIQSAVLGPLYWIIIAVPSVLWAQFFRNYRKKNNIPYSWLYCESWADKWGQRFG